MRGTDLVQVWMPGAFPAAAQLVTTDNMFTNRTAAGAWTFSGAGTGLMVTNKATVGGTLGVTGALTFTTPLDSASGGTGVNNGANKITLGGSLVTSGAFGITLTATGTTNVTLPTSGTLLNNPLSGGNLYVGSAGNVATGVALSGDVTSVTAAGLVTIGKVNTVSYPSSFTSGGIPYASAAGAISLSGALTANRLVLGGGAVATPTI